MRYYRICCCYYGYNFCWVLVVWFKSKIHDNQVDGVRQWILLIVHAQFAVFSLLLVLVFFIKRARVNPRRRIVYVFVFIIVLVSIRVCVCVCAISVNFFLHLHLNEKYVFILYSVFIYSYSSFYLSNICLNPSSQYYPIILAEFYRNIYSTYNIFII